MAGGVADEADVFEKVGGGEDGLGLGRLVVRDLRGEEAAGLEVVLGARDDAAVEVKAVEAAVEGETRLVVADVRREGGDVGGGDVGRIADDDVETRGGLERGEGGVEVALGEGEAVGDFVGGGILRARARAAGLTSTARTVAAGRLWARATAMQPEPVQRSRMAGVSQPGVWRARLMTCSTRVSVSGRGMRTSRVTASSRE